MVKFLIQRPIATLMTMLAIIVLGIISLRKVPISLMPEIDIPEITIQIDGGKMSARQLEETVIRPLRTSLLRLSHLDDIRTETSNGSAIIDLKFSYGTSIDFSFIEVNEKIDRAMANLPRDIERPKVIKANASDIPVLYLNLTLANEDDINTDGRPSPQFMDLNQFAKIVVRKRIEQLEEVALVDVSGLVNKEILVLPDRQKIATLGLSLEDVESAIKKENLDIGNVSITDGQYQYDLSLKSSLSNINDLANIYIKNGPRILQLKDLAIIKEQPQNRKGLVLFNDSEAVLFGIIKKGDRRMGALKEALGETIAQMEIDYPAIKFSITRDQTKLLDYAIGNLGQSLFWGIILAFFIIFLFIQDLKPSLLIGVSIPVSLIICLLFFDLFDISINIISLSGLILGIGLMIDNSIIVIDNIAQNLERNRNSLESCVNGTNEVIRPLVSSALTTCAVFLPLIFLNGITGAIFYDQAMAITIGLFTSLAVSMTLIPVLYYQLHSIKVRPFVLPKVFRFWKFHRLINLYENGLKLVLRNQKWAFSIFAIMALSSFGFFYTLPKSQLPKMTTTETMVHINWNRPINANENKKRLLRMLKTFGDTIIEYNAMIGQQQFLLERSGKTEASNSLAYIKTIDETNLNLVKESFKKYLSQNYPEAILEFGEVDNIFNLIFSNNDAPLTARIQNLSNAGFYNKTFQPFWQQIQESLPNVEIKPIRWEDNVLLTADLEKLALYEVKPYLLENILQSAFNTKEVLSFSNNQNVIPLILGNEQKSMDQVLEEERIPASNGVYFRLSDFIKKQRYKELEKIYGGKQGEYYPIDFQIKKDKVGKVVKVIKNITEKNPSYDVQFNGSIYESQKLLKSLTVILAITLLLLYFILASQFESLILPVIILLEIPVAVSGAFLLLFFLDMQINLMSMIGIVVMCGIVINDSILKIATIINLRRSGASLIRSIIVGGQRRLKPILMTSLTTMLAMTPVLFTKGLGSELQAPLAVTIIGGMTIGTIVSLYFVPLCYYLVYKNNSDAV